MYNEPPVPTVNTAAIERRQATIVDSAKALVVNSPETLLAGEQMVVDIKNAEKLVHTELDPGIAKANETHKHLTGQRKKYLDPLAEARQIAVGKTSAHRRKEEDERRAKEAALRKAEFEKAEEARLAEAEQLEKMGRTTEAEAVINEPVRQPIVSVAPTLPKSEVRYTTTWGAEVTDLWALIRWASESEDRKAHLAGNMTSLNAAARASKSESHIPGVEFTSKVT